MTTETYDDGVERAAHSNKGASGAERWMNCEGSTAIIEAMDLPESDEADYTREGLAGHEAGADCLARGIDTWEVAGETYHNTVIDPDMATAVQEYLDRVRPSIPADGFHTRDFFVEAKLAAPDVHAKMFGSVDFGAMATVPGVNDGWPFLDVTDLKMGKGIIVEVQDNPQMKYYAFMLIHTKFPKLADEFPVRLTIVQPRGWSDDLHVREWWTTVGAVRAWVVRDLLPAMNSTSDNLKAGDWCRFCPAKIACPLLTSLFRAASEYDPKAAVDLSPEALGLCYEKIGAVKFYLKALEGEVYRRNMMGQDVPGTKLVNKRADRIFKDTVTEQVQGENVEVPLLDAARLRFGDEAFTAPELKSPAQLEAIGSKAAKDFVKEFAYIPVTGLTVALASDRKTGVTIATVKERFGAALEKLKAETIEGD